MKACPKEEKSQKSSARLGLWGSKECQISVWNYSIQVTRRKGKKKKISSGLHPARMLYHISWPAGVAAGGHSSQTAKLPTQRQAVATGSGDISNPGRVEGPECGPPPKSSLAHQPIEPKAPCSCVLY